MYNRILVAYDGSDAAKSAFTTALDMAVQQNAELRVLTVAMPADVGDDVESRAILEHSMRYHRGLLKELVPLAQAKGIKPHYELAVGHPAEQILFHADREKVDVILVGDRGRSKFTRLLLGSVSKQVLEHASIPVLLVR